MALVDYFLKLDGIKGESLDSKHKDEIEIDSFSWGVSQTAAGGGGGGGGGRAVFHDFHFMTSVNKSSPLLFQKCASGQHLKQAVLTARKAGDKPVEFLHIKLTDVLVSSYQDQGANLGSVVVVVPPGDTIGGQIGGQRPGSGLPTDSVALRYNTAQVSSNPTHIPVTPGALGIISFDPATNSFNVIDSPNGVLTVGTVKGGISRGVEEFNVAILIGLLTNPFSATTLGLSVNEFRVPPGPPIEPPGPPTDAAAFSVAPSVNAGAEPHLFDVILYTPADGVLNVEDLTRRGKRIGTLAVDPNGPPASLDIDLTRLERRRRLDSFGIRLQLRGVRLPDLDEDKNDEPDDEDVDRANADGENHNDKNRDDKKDPQPDFSASFTLSLALDT